MMVRTSKRRGFPSREHGILSNSCRIPVCGAVGTQLHSNRSTVRCGGTYTAVRAQQSYMIPGKLRVKGALIQFGSQNACSARCSRCGAPFRLQRTHTPARARLSTEHTCTHAHHMHSHAYRMASNLAGFHRDAATSCGCTGRPTTDRPAATSKVHAAVRTTDGIATQDVILPASKPISFFMWPEHRFAPKYIPCLPLHSQGRDWLKLSRGRILVPRERAADGHRGSISMSRRLSMFGDMQICGALDALPYRISAAAPSFTCRARAWYHLGLDHQNVCLRSVQ